MSFMKKSNSYFGYGLIVVGLLLLLFSFYLGYGFYNTVLASALSSGSSQNGMASALADTLAGVIEEVGFKGFLLLIIAVIVLLVMISIGGRIIKYGLELISVAGVDEGAKEEEIKKQKSKG
ncbi:MAG: hypothetical protein ACP5TJ_00175 [Candidatus Micrarchaeia archaeon]